MRILMLVAHPNVRGPTPKHTPHLVSALRSLGCVVTTKTWGRHSDTESFWSKLVGRLVDIWRISMALHRETFDVMVIKTAHDWETLSRDLMLLLITRPLCNRIVLQFHGSEPGRLLQEGYPFFKIASKLLLCLSDAAMVLSVEEKQNWQQFDPSRNVFVVNNPFVPPVRNRTAMTAINSPQREVPILLFVGRLIKAKGIFDLLEAMPLVLKQKVCRLVVVGDGPRSGELMQCLMRHGLDNDVTLAGYLEGEELMAAYHSADIFVLPSWSEGFPFVIVEAMNAGLPIVTTHIRGMADHLTSGVNALFVAPRDPTSLADRICELLSDGGLRSRMSEMNREKVKEFAPEKVGRQYLEVLRNIVNGTGPFP